MDGAVEIYLQTAYKHFKIQPTWPPGSLVVPGWIGKVEDGQFVRTSELADYGVSARTRTQDAPAMRWASSGGVDFVASAKGSLSKAVSAIAQADAGLKIAFKKEGAIAIALDPVTEKMIRNVDAVYEWMNTDGRKILKRDHVIVTHVRQAKAGIIAMAQTAGAQVQLKTDVSLGRGKIELGEVKGKFGFVTSNSTEFIAIPSGRSGLTPFYRMLCYDDDRNIIERFFGVSEDPKVTFPKHLEMYVAPDLLQFPYDKEFLESNQ